LKMGARQAALGSKVVLARAACLAPILKGATLAVCCSMLQDYDVSVCGRWHRNTRTYICLYIVILWVVKTWLHTHHTYTHAHTYTHSHTRTHTHTHTRIHTLTHTKKNAIENTNRRIEVDGGRALNFSFNCLTACLRISVWVVHLGAP